MSRSSVWSRSIVALTLLGLLVGCDQPVKAPTAYKKWNAKDGTFALEYPEDWKADGGGAMGIQWAEFKKGPCIITVNTNVSGSVVADIAGNSTPDLGGDGEPVDPKILEQNAPAAAAHNWIKNDPSRFEQFKNYNEEEPTKIEPPIGEGRKSLFTASTSGRKVKGYRITVPARDKAIIIFAYGPEKDWSKLQGAYDKIFNGMELGQETN